VTAEQRVPYCTITLFQMCWPWGGNTGSKTGKRKCQQVTLFVVGEWKGRVIRERSEGSFTGPFCDQDDWGVWMRD